MYKKIKEIVVFAVILFMLIGTVSAAMVTNTHAHRSAKHKDTSIFSSEIERSELGILSKEKVSSAKRTSSFSQKVKYKPRKWRKYRLKWKFKKYKRQKKNRRKLHPLALLVALFWVIGFLALFAIYYQPKAVQKIEENPEQYSGIGLMRVAMIIFILVMIFSMYMFINAFINSYK